MDKILETSAETLAEQAPSVKVCTKCRLEKTLADFPPDKRGKFGKNCWCRLCHRENYRRYGLVPGVKEKRAAYFKREEIKERIKLQRNLYRQRKDVKERRSEREKNRKQIFPALRIVHNLRCRLNLAVKGLHKSKTTLKLLGCDIDFLRRWIEAKWKPGMTWDNYGFNGWHVDHIMPCAMFDLSDPVQQQTCFRWTNLQPLWAHENMSKSDRIES